MDNNNAINNYPLFSLRFSGEGIDKHLMPIYELGNTIIAIQRIINKTYLFKSERLEKGARLSFNERKETALRISEVKDGSDEYGLMPFLTDPVVVDHAKTLVVDGLFAITSYTLYKVFSKQDSSEKRDQSLVASIYNEISSLAERINNIGGVEQINIFTSEHVDGPNIVIDMNTQEYVREIQYESIYGEYQALSGYITRMYPNRFVVDIKIAPNYYSKVDLTQEDFETIRYQTKPGEIIEFFWQTKISYGQYHPESQRVRG